MNRQHSLPEADPPPVQKTALPSFSWLGLFVLGAAGCLVTYMIVSGVIGIIEILR